MGNVLTEYVEEQAYLRNLLLKLRGIFSSQEFTTFLQNSDLTVPATVSCGYPNVNSKSVDSYEIYINTSNQQNCILWDMEYGVEAFTVVDCYLPDTDMKFIWKYADAVLQFLSQFRLGLAILEMATRIYTKAEGDSANHFTISLHTLADVFNDSTNPS